MKRQRIKIPAALAADVRFAADDKCCKCKEAGSQIHHIDGNKQHNTFSNLVLLCAKCHNSASVRGSLSRKLDPALIRRYRAFWLRVVEIDRHPVTRLTTGPSKVPQWHHNRDLIVDAVKVAQIHA